MRTTKRCRLYGSLTAITIVAMTTIGYVSVGIPYRSAFRNAIHRKDRTEEGDTELEHRCRKELIQGQNCQQFFIEEHLLSGNQRVRSEECSFANLIRNCNTLLMAHDYITDSAALSIEERNFPLAFTIKIHKNPEQMEQLFRNIYRPHNVYCIHVDAKQDAKLVQDVQKFGRCFQNVVVLSKISVVYTSIRMLDAEFLCMQEMVKSPVPWKYYLNLAGQEFPLKTNLEIVKILGMLKGRNDICSKPFPNAKGRNRLMWRFRIKNNNLIKTNTIKEAFPYNITIKLGSTYGSFSREFVRFTLRDSLAQKYIAWLRDTRTPDSSIWGTLSELPMAPGGNMGASCISRAVKWTKNSSECYGHIVRNVCVCAVGDLYGLHRSPQLIVNKFDYNVDRAAEDCMEELIRNRTRDPSLSFGSINSYYYKQLLQRFQNNQTKGQT